jgi:pilus assembly protein CpaD
MRQERQQHIRASARPLAALLAALALLGACAPETAYRTRFELGRRPQVEFATVSHGVRFAAGKFKLSETEQARLRAFLAKSAERGFDRLSVRGYSDPAAEAGGIEALKQRRLGAVVAFLNGIGQAPASPPPIPGAPEDNVWVIVDAGGYVVSPPPGCPDWRKPSTWDPENTVGSNFGCATATNLGLMVAHPRDLLGGRMLAPADGGKAAAAIERYRKGEVAPLKEEKTGE